MVVEVLHVGWRQFVDNGLSQQQSSDQSLPQIQIIPADPVGNEIGILSEEGFGNLLLIRITDQEFIGEIIFGFFVAGRKFEQFIAGIERTAPGNPSECDPVAVQGFRIDIAPKIIAGDLIGVIGGKYQAVYRFQVRFEVGQHPFGLRKLGLLFYNGQRIKNGLNLHLVNVSELKSELYYRLQLNPNDDGTYPAGYIHFPNYPENYFEQLVSEIPKELPGGRIHWKALGPNEALDLAVYNRALSILLGADYLTESGWQELEKLLDEGYKEPVVSTQSAGTSRRRSVRVDLD